MPTFEELLRQLQEQHERELKDLRVQLEQKLCQQLQSHPQQAPFCANSAFNSTGKSANGNASDGRLVPMGSEDKVLLLAPLPHQIQVRNEAAVRRADSYFGQQVPGVNTAKVFSGFGRLELIAQQNVERRLSELSQRACEMRDSGNNELESEEGECRVSKCKPTSLQSAQLQGGMADRVAQARSRSAFCSHASLTARMCFRSWSDCVWPSFPDISAIRHLHEELDRSANCGTSPSKGEYDEMQGHNNLEQEFVIRNQLRASAYTAPFADELGLSSIGTRNHGIDCVPCKWQKRPGGCLHGSLCSLCHSSDHDHLSYGKRNKLAKRKLLSSCANATIAGKT